MPDRKKTREPVMTTGDIIAEQLASQWNQVGQKILRRNLNVQPTLTIRPGYRFNIVVEKDLVFEAPYRG